MRRVRFFLAAFLAVGLALAPALSMAAAGGGSSFGSRGMRTYSAPPSTRTSPYGAAPMQRSLTPEQGPSYGQPYANGYRQRSPFMSGLLGGLIGAGIGGMLFGHGLFGGISGFGSLFGLLLQIVLVVLVVRWLLRRVFGQPATVGGAPYARSAPSGRSGMAVGPAPMAGGGPPGGRPVQVAPQDYQAFEQLLLAVQAAWSAEDVNRLRALATPEMVATFADQLAAHASRGVHNTVSDVRLEQGDLAEAWAEDGREYATVAMRFAAHDYTSNRGGQVVDGSPNEWVVATEYWTFLRAAGGRWVLSAIQQAR